MGAPGQVLFVKWSSLRLNLVSWSLDLDRLTDLDRVCESAVLDLVVQRLIQVLDYHRLVLVLAHILDFDWTSAIHHEVLVAWGRNRALVKNFAASKVCELRSWLSVSDRVLSCSKLNALALICSNLEIWHMLDSRLYYGVIGLVLVWVALNEELSELNSCRLVHCVDHSSPVILNE